MDMKICSKCKISRPESDYFIKSTTPPRLHAQCKQCYKEHRRTYYADHYAKYGQLYRERAKVRREMLRNLYHDRILSYLKTHPCSTCRENDVRVLEFDHLDPTEKTFSISFGIRYGRPWPQIEAEIGKCQVLCANCHKKRTAEQAGWYKKR